MVMFGYFFSNEETRSASCFLAASSAVGSRPATLISTGSVEAGELSADSELSAGELSTELDVSAAELAALVAASLVDAALVPAAEVSAAEVVAAGAEVVDPESELELQA